MIEWPEGLYCDRMRWGRAFNNKAFTSVFTNAQQIRTYPGAYWKCTMQFQNLNDREERLLTTLVGSLQGMAGTFKLYPWRRSGRPDHGTVRVNGNGNASGTLPSRGWQPSTLVLRMGDYITVNDQLLEVLADVTSNGQGNATIQVAPWLRLPPADGTEINYTRPFAIMRLTSDDEENTIRSAMADGTLDCREAF
ncbi:hypothetical protein [Salinicola acroporae]|uniref:Uncharacterized protein n=1 Tax=Salinicola acroporae TaxID=1541440 RepID=A0ABT6I5G0_9GAMM|nr:hypothetical protein [Salinicola acroporae]MDH4572475.1 hypothetical protein [Salinicola acroporae]